MKNIIIIQFCLLLSFAFTEVSVSKANGGSMVTKLGFGLKINKDSKLEREWYTVNNSYLPIEFVGNAGISIKYADGYQYEAAFKIKANENISAFEIIFVTFDLWGEKVDNLGFTKIVELSAGESYDMDGAWTIYRESTASEFFTSLAYFSAVRTNDGRIIKPNPEDIVKVAQDITEEFTREDLKIEEAK